MKLLSADSSTGSGRKIDAWPQTLALRETDGRGWEAGVEREARREAGRQEWKVAVCGEAGVEREARREAGRQEWKVVVCGEAGVASLWLVPVGPGG